MNPSFTRKAISHILGELERLDGARKVFGSGVHQYRLQPPLSISVIETFENQNKVTLPGDYKYFITEIGNGGAGPYYGLFPFGKQSDFRQGFHDWVDAESVGDLSKPFPHTATWNVPASFWQQQPNQDGAVPAAEGAGSANEWFLRLEEEYFDPSLVNGAIPICHQGCGVINWLVANGPQAGFVWEDHRTADQGIYPVHDEAGDQTTFSDWYMGWLHRASFEVGIG
jgi:hypothetical protein